MDYQKHSTEKEEKSLGTRSSTSTDASLVSSHPARQRALRSLGITEAEFMQGLESRGCSESLGYNRETGESKDRPSSPGKEKDRLTTIEGHLQKLNQRETSLSEVSKELDQTARIITHYEKQPPSTLKGVLEIYEKIKECSKNLNLEDLEIFKNGKLKEVLKNIYSSAKMKIDDSRIQTKNQNIIKWIDKNKYKAEETIFLKIYQSDEYSRFKDICTNLKNIFGKMEELDKKSIASESSQGIIHQKDQILNDLTSKYGEYSKAYKVLMEKFQDDEIKQKWIEEGRKVLERVKDLSAKRQKEGMTRSVIEESWRSFYEYKIYKAGDPNAVKREEFDKLMKEGKLIGEKGDYYTIRMQSKMLDNSKKFDGDRPALTVSVNPKEGVLVSYQAYREIDQQWRDENFPKEFMQNQLKDIKNRLGIQELPKEFFKALPISDLTVLAYQLAVEKYKEEQSQSGDQDDESHDSEWLRRDPNVHKLLSENDLSSVPLRELMITKIVNPAANIMLHGYSESKEPQILRSGNEGFNLVSATPSSRRVPFMLADYPDIIGDGEIDRYEIHMVSDELNIKGVIKPKDKSDA